MKKNKVQSNINLESLAGGAFTEKLNEALMQVAENIQDPNTEATAKRGITVNIKIAPNKNRTMASASISVSTKLAAAEAIDAQLVMGLNMKTGQTEIAEYSDVYGNQITFEDLKNSENTEQPENEAPEPEQPQPNGKPLDLRNRGKKQEPELVPGKDFDPETGEVYKPTGRVVPINKKQA